MKKSIIIIVAVIGVFITAVLIIIFTLSGEDDSLSLSTPPVSRDILPVLPDSARDQYIKVDDLQNTETAKEIFEEFAKEAVPKSAIRAGVRNIKITDANGKLFDLTKIITSLDINIPEPLLGLVETKNFELFYCPIKNKEKDFGLVLYAKAREDRPLYAEDYQKINDQMRQWENTMLRDMYSMLFLNVYFSDDQLSQVLRFQDGETRFANVQLPNGMIKSINYKQFGSPVVIASSLKCLNNAEEYFFDTEEK